MRAQILTHRCLHTQKGSFQAGLGPKQIRMSAWSMRSWCRPKSRPKKSLQAGTQSFWMHRARIPLNSEQISSLILLIMRRIQRSLYVTVNYSFFSSLKLTWKQLSAVNWSRSSVLEALDLQGCSTQRNIGKNQYDNRQCGNGPFQTCDQYNDKLYINCWYTGKGRKCSFNTKGNGKGKCRSDYSCKQLYLTVSAAAASEFSPKKNSGKCVKERSESPEVVMQKHQKLTNREEFDRFPVWIRLLGWLTNSIRHKIQPDCLGKGNGILARSKAVLGPC